MAVVPAGVCVANPKSVVEVIKEQTEEIRGLRSDLNKLRDILLDQHAQNMKAVLALQKALHPTLFP